MGEEIEDGMIGHRTQRIILESLRRLDDERELRGLSRRYTDRRASDIVIMTEVPEE